MALELLIDFIPSVTSNSILGMRHLALVLRDQGKYEQAEEMHRKELGLRETVLGKEHPSTLTSEYSQERTLPKSTPFLGDRSQERGAPRQSLLGTVCTL
jgi:hypothetical protein